MALFIQAPEAMSTLEEMKRQLPAAAVGWNTSAAFTNFAILAVFLGVITIIRFFVARARKQSAALAPAIAAPESITARISTTKLASAKTTFTGSTSAAPMTMNTALASQAPPLGLTLTLFIALLFAYGLLFLDNCIGVLTHGYTLPALLLAPLTIAAAIQLLRRQPSGVLLAKIFLYLNLALTTLTVTVFFSERQWAQFIQPFALPAILYVPWFRYLIEYRHWSFEAFSHINLLIICIWTLLFTAISLLYLYRSKRLKSL